MSPSCPSTSSYKASPHRPPGPSRLRRRARRAAPAEEVNAPGKLAVEEFAILHPTSADVHPSHELHDHAHEAAPSPRDDPPKHVVQVGV